MRERTRAVVGAACAIVALGGALGGCDRPMTDRELAYGRRTPARHDDWPNSAAAKQERHLARLRWDRGRQEIEFLREMSRDKRR